MDIVKRPIQGANAMTYLPLASYLIQELSQHPSDAPHVSRRTEPVGRTTRRADTEDVVIRRARGSDAAGVERLAVLDSRPVPEGDLLVAERDEQLLAVLGVQSRTYVADPFERTSEVVWQLAERAAELRANGSRRPTLSRLARWSGLWARAAHAHPTQ
jgi:hypothetical protein